MCNGILHVNTKLNILSVTKYVQKMFQKPYSEFWGKKWHSKAQKVILSERFGAPCGEWEISQGAIVIACATVLLWLEFFKNFRLPGRQFKNRIHQPDSKIHQLLHHCRYYFNIHWTWLSLHAVSAVSGRLPDNSGELAYVALYLYILYMHNVLWSYWLNR